MIGATAQPRSAAKLGRQFWLLWSAVFVANLGDGLTLTALPWAAAELTSNPLKVSAIAMAGRLPWLLAALPAGLLIDRLRWSVVIRWASLARCAVLSILALLLGAAHPPFAILAIFAFLLGLTEVFFDTAAETAVPFVVDKSALVTANGRLRAAEIVTNDFLGRPLGGLILTAGLAVTFGVNAIAAGCAFLIVAALLSAGRAVESRPTIPGNSWEEVRAGWTFVWHEPLLRQLGAKAAVMSLLYAGMLGIQVLYIQRVVGTDSLGYGLLLVLASIGALAGTQIAPHATARLGRAWALLLPVLLMGLSFLAIGLVSGYGPLAALFVVAGAIVASYSVVSGSVRQEITPELMLGRVAATFRLLSWGVSAIGMAAGGVLVTVAERFVDRSSAVRTPYLLAAAGFLVLFFVSVPRIRQSMQGASRL